MVVWLFFCIFALIYNKKQLEIMPNVPITPREQLAWDFAKAAHAVKKEAHHS